MTILKPMYIVIDPTPCLTKLVIGETMHFMHLDQKNSVFHMVVSQQIFINLFGGKKAHRDALLTEM